LAEEGALETADRVIASSVAEIDDLARYHLFQPDRVVVNRPGVDTMRFTPIGSSFSAGISISQFINAEDCEKVTRQLQFVLEVEGTAYSRLEVSSPGIDRPLRTENDFARFVGQEIDLTLKAPMGAAAAGLVAANRKKFRGVLESTDTPQTWQITWRDEPVSKPGMRPARVQKDLPVQALQFTLSELRDARLAPIVNFKGRRATEDRSTEP
jgi:ribosome maturation factor RimP